MPALIPLALALAPQIGQWLFGSTGAKVTQAAVDAVRAVTGTDDPAAASAALAADPAAAAALKSQLAQIAAAAEIESLRATLADRADARRQTVSLAGLGSLVQWAAPVISAVVLATFGAVMWLALTRSLPAGSETILNMLLGTLAAMANSVVCYWVGSSAGSERKTTLLAQAPAIPQA